MVIDSSTPPPSTSADPAARPADNAENGHPGGPLENTEKGRGYDRRGGHQDTKQGRKERKKGKKEMGRTAYSRSLETREPARSAEPATKRPRLDGEETPAAAAAEEDGEKEARRPKRKVAVLIGYSGHGYKGMQLNYPNKTIEGDLFEAFVRAGAISRANSNDPKKSSLVRCARTDKGVHAAGNVISLKLIIEDEDIVDKINSHLPDQIRVWGILRTLSSFNCYQLCDSRVYEYLIPSYVFLPPHPGSYLGKMLSKHAAEEGDVQGWEARQEEVKGFWDQVEIEVDRLLESEGFTRADLEAANEALFEDELNKEINERAAAVAKAKAAQAEGAGETQTEAAEAPQTAATETNASLRKIPDDLVKRIKSLHLTHKRSFRLPPARLARIRSVLQSYCGTHNFHNYTIQKSFRDPSAKRHIKTFIAQDPILINNVEYLSLRVHGQSFMMHQIRKMVGLALLVVRCGADPKLIPTTYTDVALAIPKAPGVGLLLDHPVFESYNKKCTQFPDRDPVEFTRYAKQIDHFREKYIYGRMFDEEEKQGLFHAFVSFIDSYRSEAFLYLGSKGVKAVEGLGKGGKRLEEVTIRGVEEEGEEEDVPGGMEG